MSTHTSLEERVFAEALDQPEHERVAFVNGACHGDAALRERILALLQAHAGTSSLLGSAPVAAGMIVAAEEKPGDHIGRYKLLQKIGEGGCGVVWMAEQEEPVRRRVALKVIKLGMDTKAVVARFEAERQALALMDHPNIAKVHDAGATETGRPFFVMELVRGIPITKYCDENQLTPVARLELFIKVCQAIQHAHQKGVIHRDIKPSNILVTVNDGQPTPKVIDFGIAKATQGRLTDATVFTAFEQFIGTPVYMSPEQAEMSSLDIDTRSDIYSLGVLLYELLTGRPPFDAKAFAQAGVDQIRQQIREREPQTPSHRLHSLADAERTTVAKLRSTAPAQLSLLLRGDLDWIVMRCLEKDRTRRYDTANGLAMDIQRHLRNEPVTARPPSTAYLLEKLIRRHRLAFAAAAAIGAVVVIGAIVSSWQAVRATRAEREQTRLRETAQKAQVGEAQLRRKAQAEALAARQKAYASDMNLVQQALAVDNLGRARGLLERQRPQPGQVDLRGWEWRYLWQFCQSDAQLVLCQKSYAILSLAVSPDGKWLAVGEDEKGGLSLRSLQTPQETRVPAGGGAVHAVFAPREPLLAIAIDTLATQPNREFGIVIWNIETRREVRRWALDSLCNGLSFSEDGRTLITATTGTDEQIVVWRVSDGKKLAGYPARMADSMWGPLAVTRDLRVAAYAGTDATVRVIDLATRRERWKATSTDEVALTVAISPDGTLIATGAGFADGIIRLWDMTTGQESGRLEGHRGDVRALVFWPDGKTLASAGGDSTIRLWNMHDRRLLRTLRGHELEVWSLALLPDNRTLVSGSKDGSVFLWDTMKPRAGGAYVTLPKPVSGWCFGAENQSVLTVDSEGKIERWSGDAFEEKDAVMQIGRIEHPWSVEFAADCPLVAVGSDRGVVKVFDWERRSLVREFKATDKRVDPIRFLARGSKLMLGYGTVTEFFWSSLHEWNPTTGQETRSWPNLLNSRSNVGGVSPDEQWFLVFGFQGGDAALLNLATGQTTNPNLKLRQVDRFSFSPDGKHIAAPSQLGFARIWDAKTHREVATLSGFMLGVHSAVFSPDGRRVATGSNGIEAVKLWDFESHENVLTLEGRGSMLRRTAFSPDGNVIGGLSSSQNGVLNLWRAPSWAEIAAAEKSAATKQPRP